MNQIVWTDTALTNLQAIQAYIAQYNPSAAHAVAAELITAGNSLEHFPHRGRPVSGSETRELVTAYSYVVRYRIVGNTVFILRIRHTSRRPTKP